MSTIRDTAQPVSALICPRELPGDGEVHGDTSASHDVTNTLQADRHGGEWSSHDSNESAGPDGPPDPPNVQDPASCGVRRALFECAGGSRRPFVDGRGLHGAVFDPQPLTRSGRCSLTCSAATLAP